MKIFMMVSILILSSFTQAQTQIPDSTSIQLQVHFRSGQIQASDEARFNFATELRTQIDAYRRQLEDAGVDLENREIKVKQVVIKSRTDARGSAEANMAISEKRAQGLVYFVEDVFAAQALPYDAEEITAVGLGETEADEESCKTVQLLCSIDDKIHLIDENKKEETWVAQLLNQIGELILPSSHARDRKTLLDMLFGNEDTAQPEQVYNEPIEDHTPPEEIGEPDRLDTYLYENNLEQPEQCSPVVWDEDCLETQRVTTVDLVLENGLKQEKVELPEVIGVDTPVGPATQEDVTGNTPPTSDDVPADEKPPEKLKVYGTPLGN
jgi:hypothetical protein